LYVINLNVVSLFRDSSYMFLTILNDKIYQFEWMNIILLLKKRSQIMCNQNM